MMPYRPPPGSVTNREKILVYLAQHPHSTMLQIVCASGILHKTASRELKVLQALGEVKIDDPWLKRHRHYSLGQPGAVHQPQRYKGVPAGPCISRQYAWAAKW